MREECACGGILCPLVELTAENTKPSAVTKEVAVDFLCETCHRASKRSYTLPTLHEDVAKNALHYIYKSITSNPLLLISNLTLNPSNVLEVKGIEYALGYLQQKGVICELNKYTFKLTFIGQLMYWHGYY